MWPYLKSPFRIWIRSKASFHTKKITRGESLPINNTSMFYMLVSSYQVTTLEEKVALHSL